MSYISFSKFISVPKSTPPLEEGDCTICHPNLDFFFFLQVKGKFSLDDNHKP